MCNECHFHLPVECLCVCVCATIIFMCSVFGVVNGIRILHDPDETIEITMREVVCWVNRGNVSGLVLVGKFAQQP